MKFEWDEKKAASNVGKHGVSFEEAASVFLDRLAVSGPDPDHSVGEPRYITFGMSGPGALAGGFPYLSYGRHPNHHRTPRKPC